LERHLWELAQKTSLDAIETQICLASLSRKSRRRNGMLSIPDAYLKFSKNDYCPRVVPNIHLNLLHSLTPSPFWSALTPPKHIKTQQATARTQITGISETLYVVSKTCQKLFSIFFEAKCWF